MSVLSPKRVIQFVVASLLAVPLLANHPSPRLQARMAFDEAAGRAVLFGGRGIEDPATGLTHATDETWVFVRDQWLQQFPATSPSGRSAHAMAYDSKRARVLLYGGRAESTELRGKFSLLNDMWEWKNNDWQKLEITTPPARNYADMAYDRARDRLVLFGGYRYSADGKILEPLYDTWEFDGSAWSEVQTAANGPKVDKPAVVYDVARNQTILMGIDTEFKTQMYRWDSEGKSWQKITPDPLPPCANESTLAYQAHNQTLVLTGGLCADSAVTDEVWEWNGETWTKIDAKLNGFSQSRTTGSAGAYDTLYERFIRFGGVSNFGTLNESTTYLLRDVFWRSTSSVSRPNPRSLATFRRDPARGTIWLFGGLNEYSQGSTISYNADLWRYVSGQGWLRDSRFASPGECPTPAAAFDTDRQVLVVVCGGQAVWEWNGAEWKEFSPKPVPDFRRFAAIVYDQNIKKTVMFGGYDNINYRDETWTWDGTTWTKLKPSKKPGNRAQMSMWYDTRAKKTILYSGAGRPNIDEHVTRYEDMWSFDGTTWTELTKTAAPGIRFGAQVAVDPRDGKVLLFGGLRATVDEDDNVDQFYGDDTWQWDGTAGNWTRLTPARSPRARQNGALEFDEAAGRFVLHGGFAGQFYLSDTWVFDGTSWTPVPDKLSDTHRRAARP
jgi:hypothetical protein